MVSVISVLRYHVYYVWNVLGLESDLPAGNGLVVIFSFFFWWFFMSLVSVGDILSGGFGCCDTWIFTCVFSLFFDPKLTFFLLARWCRVEFVVFSDLSQGR